MIPTNEELAIARQAVEVAAADDGADAPADDFPAGAGHA